MRITYSFGGYQNFSKVNLWMACNNITLLTKIIENKNTNFAQLSDGLGVVHAKVKEVSDTFAQKIEAEEEKVL